MWRYFDREEFACNCGCGGNEVKDELIDKLNEARGEAGVPFLINSGYRCEYWNKKEGGKKLSAHLRGWGADIRAASSYMKFMIVRALLDAGFTRIGISDTFIHADLDPDLDPEVLWTY